MTKHVLFIYGTRVRRDEKGELYCGLNEKVWDRYRKWGNDLTFLGVLVRGIYSSKELQSTSNLLTNIHFVEYFKQNTIKTFFDIRIKFKNKSIIRTEIDKANIIIIRMPTQDGGYALRYALKRNKRTIVEVVGCPFDALWNHSWKGKLLAIFRMMELKRNIKHAPNVIYVTNEFLQKRYPTKGKSIGCSDVALKNVDDTVLQKRLSKISTSSKEIVLGTIGGYAVKYKCQDILIRIVAELKNRGYQVKGQLVGGGDSSDLVKLAKRLEVIDNIDFIGSLKHEDIFKWLDTLDFYMQLSKQEGLPRSVVEAMSRGVPCIGSKVGGIPELIQPELCFCHDKKMVKNIVNSIIVMIDNPTLLKEVSIHNFNKAKKYEYHFLENKRDEFLMSCLENIK